MKSFAFALNTLSDSLLCSVTVSFFEPIYTNLKAEWLSLLCATDSTHHSTHGKHAQVYDVFVLICSPAGTQYGGLCTSLALTGLFVVCLYAENANLSIYPALPACPLRSLCSPSSTLPRIILLTVVTFGSVVSAHHIHTSRYTHCFVVVVFLVICVNMCKEDPNILGLTSGRFASILPYDFSAHPSACCVLVTVANMTVPQLKLRAIHTVDRCRLWTLAQSHQPLGHI